GTAKPSPSRASSQAARSFELRPYTSSPATHPNGTLAVTASATISVPCTVLVANIVPSGTCARSRRAVSSHHGFGRYRRKLNSVWARAVTQARNTTVWQFPVWPVIPACWRATPTVILPFFSSAVSSSTRIAPGSARCARMNCCSRPSTVRQSHVYSASSACIRRGVACPACSPSCQHDLRSPATASSAATYANAANQRDVARDLLEAGPPPRDLLAGKGFNGKTFAAAQAARGTAVLVPPTKN